MQFSEIILIMVFKLYPVAIKPSGFDNFYFAGTYLNPGKSVIRADKLKKGKGFELTVGDVFGIPVRSKNDQSYEMCRFLIEELIEDHVHHLSCMDGKLVDKDTFAKVGDLDRKKNRSRRQMVDVRNIKRKHDINKKSDSLGSQDLDDLCAEINFLRETNENFNLSGSEDLTFLQRAQKEVLQARKQLSTWAFQNDVPNDIAVTIQNLVQALGLFFEVFGKISAFFRNVRRKLRKRS